KQAGTGANYKGLYAATEQFAAVSHEQLDKVSPDYPEVAQLDDFVKLMVQVEHRFDHLKAIAAAGWKTPAKQPDLEPAHEALLLREAYAELARLPETKQRGEELLRWLTTAAADAQALEDALLSGARKGGLGNDAVAVAFRKCSEACAHCHRQYRDVTR